MARSQVQFALLSRLVPLPPVVTPRSSCANLSRTCEHSIPSAAHAKPVSELAREVPASYLRGMHHVRDES